MTLAVLCGILMLGGTVKGVIGTAYPVIVVPLMSSVVDVPTAVALAVLPSVASNVWQARLTRDSLAMARRLWPVIVPLCLGLWWSAGMMTEARPRTLFFALGLLVVVFAVLSLANPNLRIPRRAERSAGLVAGVFAGLIGGFSTIFGPPITMYLVALHLEKDELIRSTGLVFFAGSLMLAGSYWAHDVLRPDNLAWAIAACVPVIVGYAIGESLRRYVNPRRFRQLLLIALLLIGLNLLRRGLFA